MRLTLAFPEADAMYSLFWVKLGWPPRAAEWARRRHHTQKQIPSGAAMDKVSLSDKFSKFAEHWRPKLVAELNGQEVKLVKVQGVFPWHLHEAEDELFLVWRGRFRVEFRDRTVELGPGELVVVPRGIEHRTAADEEAEVLIFEPTHVRNTGNVVDERFTAPDRATI